ncbi:MAG: hypothetical protein P8P83_04130 [Rickettsiaceae bacterium]|nr:hypothetical protein [Rickettsiaceae bacterium]
MKFIYKKVKRFLLLPFQDSAFNYIEKLLFLELEERLDMSAIPKSKLIKKINFLKQKNL